MFTFVLQFNALIRCWGQWWWHSLVLWRMIFAYPKIITAWFVKVVFCDTVSVKAAHPPRTPTAATGDSRGVGYFSIVVLNNNGTPRMKLLIFFFLNSKRWLWKQPTVRLTRSFSLKIIYSCSFHFSSLSHGTDMGHCLTPPRQLTLSYGMNTQVSSRVVWAVHLAGVFTAHPLHGSSSQIW